MDTVERFGSIPAHAGEPPIVRTCSWCERVYPRACGGTTGMRGGPVMFKGLSPRMRGNRAGGGWQDGADGSIPAHAGEPCSRAVFFCVCTVYPRACGGTKSLSSGHLYHSGLSPRMRGNLTRIQPQ